VIYKLFIHNIDMIFINLLFVVKKC